MQVLGLLLWLATSCIDYYPSFIICDHIFLISLKDRCLSKTLLKYNGYIHNENTDVIAVKLITLTNSLSYCDVVGQVCMR